MSQLKNYQKIAVIGSPSTGKTTAIRRFVNLITPSVIKPQQCNFYHYTQENVDIEILDTSGEIDPSSATFQQFLDWADGIIVIYAIDNKESFEMLENYIEPIKKMKSVPFIIVGNKVDLDKRFKRAVEESKALALSNDNRTSYIEISARNCFGVKKMFTQIVNLVTTFQKHVHPSMTKASHLLTDFSLKTNTELSIPGRKLIIETYVYKLSKSNQKKESHLFLFNDYLVFAKPNRQSPSQCDKAFPLVNIVLLDKVNEKDEFSFYIFDITKKQQYQILFNSEADKYALFDTIEEQLGELKNHESRLKHYDDVLLYQLRMVRSKRIFGVNLRHIMNRSNNYKNPLIGEDLIKHLRKKKCLHVPGLFRLPGTKSVISKLKTDINTGKDVKFLSHSPIDIGYLLLTYLKLLPISLIPFELNPVLVSLDMDANEDTLKVKLHEIISCVPQTSFGLLAKLMKFLKKAISVERLNCLTFDIAGKIFSEVLIQCNTEDRPKANQIISFLIKHCTFIFKKRKYRLKLRSAPEFLVQINTMKTLKRLETYKSKLLILHSLAENRGSSNMIVESGLQSTIINLNSLLSYDVSFVKEVIDMTHYDNLHFLLIDLEKLLTSKKGKLFKNSLSHSEKKQIERIQSRLQDELNGIYSYLDSQSNWTSDERTAYFKIKKEIHRNLQLKKPLFSENETFDELMSMLYPLFRDSTSRNFWEKNFGLEKFIIEKDLFISALTDVEPNDETRRMLSNVLDHFKKGTVNIFIFSQFLAGFGSIKTCVSNLIKMYQEKWFYGFISHQEAIRLLELSKPNTFLVRFTDSSPGNFTIEHVIYNPLHCNNNTSKELEIESVHIISTPLGFQIKSADEELDEKDSKIKIYDSIWSVIEKNANKFKYPFISTFYDHVWFHGNLDSHETSEQLKEKPEGTFLVRFSNEVGCLTCSFVCKRATNLSIEHLRLERNANDQSIKQGSKIHASIEDCIKANEKWLSIPYEMKYEKEETLTIEDGTVEKIVEILYDGEDFSVNTIFLLTYRSFSTPNAVLHILRERFQYFKANNSKKQKLRICNFIKVWIQEYFWDIKDDQKFLKNCNALIKNIIEDHATSTLGKNIQAIMDKQVVGYEEKKREEELKPIRVDRIANDVQPTRERSETYDTLSLYQDDDGNESEKNVPNPIEFNRKFSISAFNNNKPKKIAEIRSVLDLNVQDLVGQITLIESELFVRIATYEFLDQGWLKGDKERRSPNLLRMIRFSNRISRWVATEILAHDKIQMRVKVIEYFVNAAKEYMKIGNFNAVYEILAGFDSSSIGRLYKTWQLFEKSKKNAELAEIRSAFSFDNNWSSYRKNFNNAAPPKIPYLGLILTDLVFVEEANPDRLPNGQINWTKCERTAEILHHIQLCQQERYTIPPDDSIIDTYLFERVTPLSDDDAYKRSLEVEPRSSKKED